jgi:hypothetical protein
LVIDVGHLQVVHEHLSGSYTNICGLFLRGGVGLCRCKFFFFFINEESVVRATLENHAIINTCLILFTAKPIAGFIICYGIHVYELSLGCCSVLYSTLISSQGSSYLPIFIYGTKFCVQCQMS